LCHMLEPVYAAASSIPQFHIGIPF
jgi:hypothetical protein